MKSYLWLGIFFISSLLSANELKDHHSPYLAMHGNDPINWVAWDESILGRAKKENKLLFISVGYYACHWCHVMHRESFSDAGIAQLLNDHYIAVKVDRELNPILDKQLIRFVQATQGHAGWPLNVFVTPEGNALVGVTYLPKKRLTKVLNNITKEWEKDSKNLSQQAKEQVQHLNIVQQNKEKKGNKSKIADSTNNLIKQIMANADTFSGGFGQQTKFPSTTQLHALMILNREKKDQSIDDFVRLTLDAMATKGLHDELAGGFYRYTVDQEWSTPHFEKMLYNNATLAILYADAAKQYDSVTYRKWAVQTLRFLIQTMKTEQGAYIASLSSVDSQGVEGGFYYWDVSIIKSLLSKQEYQLASQAWQLKEKATEVHLKGDYDIADLAKSLQISRDEVENSLAIIRYKLLKHRKTTHQLPRDDKLLTTWNGLVLAAFARVNEKAFAKEGQQLADFLINLWDGKQLYRSSEKKQFAILQDYASASWGLLLWAQQSGDKKSQQVGLALVTKAWADFYVDQHWRLAKDKVLKKDVLHRHISDSPYPSPETLLLRASFLSQQKEIILKAHQVLKISSQNLEEKPYSYASLIELSNQ
ncbi:MAG: thioredoxin domain-containing protein [Thiotrichaceae bacterium]|nr:thioredoxin domain-containing protein [Thiotrichaceae bacterium]